MPVIKFNNKKVSLIFEIDNNPALPTNIHAIIDKKEIHGENVFFDMANGIEHKNPMFLISDNIEENDQELSCAFDNVLNIGFNEYCTVSKFQKDYSNPHINYQQELDSIHFESNFIYKLKKCFENEKLNSIWVMAIKNLNTHNNFETELIDEFISIATIKPTKSFDYKNKISSIIKYISKMHLFAIAMITDIIATLDFGGEKYNSKTLILINKIESYFNPTLLSDFMLALSDISKEYQKINQNSDPILLIVMLTSSPIVLQQIPSLCISILTYFYNGDVFVFKPSIETLGESIGTIYRDVLYFDSSNTAYANIIKDKSFLSAYESNHIKLGGEARMMVAINKHYQ